MSTPAFAASYGDFLSPIELGRPAGRQIDFLGVSDEHGRYGIPQSGFQDLSFRSPDLDAACSQCPAGQRSADTLNLEIRHGRSIPFPYGFGVSVDFDYALQSFDPKGAAAVSFAGDIRVEILEVDDRPVKGLTESIPLEFYLGGSDLESGGALGKVHARIDGFGVESGLGYAYTPVDLSGLIYDAGLQGTPTLTRLAFENAVVVRHRGIAGHAAARIRGVDISVGSGIFRLDGQPAVQTRAVLPEPSTALLLLLGLGWMSARRRNQANPSSCPPASC